MKNIVTGAKLVPQKVGLALGALVATSVALATVLVGSAAYADAPTALVTATSTLQSDLLDFVTTYGIPFVVVLFAIGVCLTVFIKYGRKAAKTAGG